MCDEVTIKAPIYGKPPCGRVRVQPASPQLLSAIDNPISGRWIINISSSALYLLEQMYEIENDPPLHMCQRLATDLEVSQRQVFARARPPVRARPGSLYPLLRATRAPLSLPLYFLSTPLLTWLATPSLRSYATQIQVWFQNRRSNLRSNRRDRNLIKASEKLYPKMESSVMQRPGKEEASDHCDAAGLGPVGGVALAGQEGTVRFRQELRPLEQNSSTPSSLASPSQEQSHSGKTVPSLQMAPPTARLATFEQSSTDTSANGSDYGTNSNQLERPERRQGLRLVIHWRGANSMTGLDMQL